jgi:hypothetical protein
MHNAWRKRAEEAEAALAAMQPVPVKDERYKRGYDDGYDAARNLTPMPDAKEGK